MRVGRGEVQKQTKKKKSTASLTSVGLKQSTSKSWKTIKDSVTLYRLFGHLYVSIRALTQLRKSVSVSYLDPGRPLNVTGHVQQFIHVYLKLWDGLLL